MSSETVPIGSEKAEMIMRVKCEKRRQAILDVAEQVFREKGFELTSMPEITARVGGSKATLYNYFASKEDLFLEVMHRFAETAFEAFFEGLDCNKDMQTTMQQFGEQFLEYICQPQMSLSALRKLFTQNQAEPMSVAGFTSWGPQDGARKMGLYLRNAANSESCAHLTHWWLHSSSFPC